MRVRFSYANVTATAALVVALGGGGAYAASVITGEDVQDGSLTGRDIKDGSVGGVDVRNHSLLLKDFEGGQIPGAKSVSVGADQPLTLTSGGDWTTVAELKTTTTVAGVFMFSGAVEEASTSKSDSGLVQLRIVHNGHVHPLASRTTVGPGESEVGLALFVCNEDPGSQSIQLQAQTTGADVEVGARTFTLAQTAALP